MRLGFAIASHVEADILLIDEVLAVGDAEFQQKCADWLEKLRAADTTVLIVSHNLPTLESLCDRVVWMEHGRVLACGEAGEIVSHYSRHHLEHEPVALDVTS